MDNYNLTDGYNFKGFKAMQKILYLDKKPNARIIQLKRIQKKLCAFAVENIIEPTTTKNQSFFVIFHVGI